MGTLQTHKPTEPIVRGRTAGELLQLVGDLQYHPTVIDPIWILLQLDTYEVQMLDKDRDLLVLLERTPIGKDFIGEHPKFGHYVHVEGSDTHEYAIACVSAYTLTQH